MAKASFVINLFSFIIQLEKQVYIFVARSKSHGGLEIFKTVAKMLFFQKRIIVHLEKEAITFQYMKTFVDEES